MSEHVSPWSLQSVAKELDISPASLRRWSDEFTDYLSREAGQSKDRALRRYTEADLKTLKIIKELMNDGLTYDQVRQHLNERAVRSMNVETLVGSPGPDGDFTSGANSIEEDEDVALVTSGNGSESPAIAFLTNTLSTLADSQKSILNSQVANRELLGVLLQDNFNLKEENNRLRERILEVERDLGRSRQEEAWRRESLRQELEAKISAANQLATEAIGLARSVETPEIKAIETKPGCWGMIFGRGGTQIITAYRRRKSQQTGSTAPSMAAIPQNPPSSPGPPSPQKHPKPMFPPE